MGENIQSQSVVPQVQQQGVKSERRGLLILLAILTLIVVITIIGVGAYLIGKDQGEKNSSDDDTNISVSEIPTSDDEIDTSDNETDEQQ